MDVLKSYFDYVATLESHLETILSEELILKLNLKNVFADVVIVAPAISVQGFFDMQMSKSHRSFDQLINQIKSCSVNCQNGLVIDPLFFNEPKFKYLFDLIGEAYFCKLMDSFQFYHLNLNNDSLHLKLGKRLDENQQKKDESFELPVDKLQLPINLEFCERNLALTGKFRNNQPEYIEHQGLNDVNYDNEIANLFSFKREISDDITKYVEQIKSNHKSSYLLDKKISGKYNFYDYEYNNHTLDRERIYFNQNFEKSRSAFIDQFAHVNEFELFDEIFKNDTNLATKTKGPVKIKLLELFRNFIMKHKVCNFQDHLENTCKLEKETTDTDEPRYVVGFDLFKINKQDEIARYMTSVFEEILGSSIIGRENFNALIKWFKLIPFQHKEVELFFSNFYNNIHFKELDWLNSLNIQDKIRIIDLIIKWLSGYVLNLLKASFFILKEERLRFYRYDFWNAILDKQLEDWCSFKMIAKEGRQNFALNEDQYLNSRLKITASHHSIELHSNFDDQKELDDIMRLCGLTLKVIRSNNPLIFNQETDFYNKLKKFNENSKLLHDDGLLGSSQFCFKLDFDQIVQEINQDALNEIIKEKLGHLSNFNFQIRKLIVYQKPKLIKKKEIYYLANLNEERNLFYNLQLNGIYDLENSVIYDQFYQAGDFNLHNIHDVIYKFIKNNRMHFDGKNEYIRMIKGIPFNHHLTDHLTAIYISTLVETFLPGLVRRVIEGDQSVFCCCSESSILILSDSQEDARFYFDELVKNLKAYGLKINYKTSFSNIESRQSPHFSKVCSFKSFNLLLKHSKPVDYKCRLFNIRNVKSSYSFHLFELPKSFQTRIIDKFLSDFKVFNLDEACCPFNDLTYRLFSHFGLFAVQIYYFFDNTHALKLDHDPRLLCEIIFDLILSLLSYVKKNDRKIHEFNFNLDFYSMIWLLVKSFLLTWKIRPSEIKILEKLEKLIEDRVPNEDLKNFDLKSAFINLFRDVDFCVTRTNNPNRSRSRSRSRSRRRHRSSSRRRHRSRSRSRSRRHRSRSRSRSRRHRSRRRSRSKSRRRSRSRSRRRSYSRRKRSRSRNRSYSRKRSRRSSRRRS